MHHREDFDAFSGDTVDDAVGALQQFTQVGKGIILRLSAVAWRCLQLARALPPSSRPPSSRDAETLLDVFLRNEPTRVDGYPVRQLSTTVIGAIAFLAGLLTAQGQ